MEIRPMTAADLHAVRDIDATIESAEYLHIHREGEGLSSVWKIELRRFREARTHRQALDDDTAFAIKQMLTGIEEGIALVAEHEGTIAAAAAARPDATAGLMRLLDLRVDFDFRRQGLASGLLFQIIQEARQRDLRAVAAQTMSDHFPSVQILSKLNFELAGFDTQFKSNHDLVKDSVVLFWYLQLK
jgi:N-acetylglutamate synthase-like GNAT family acetyltransferase